MMKSLTTGMLAAITILLCGSVSAANDKQSAFYISANKVSLSKKTGISEYHGNVRIRHGDLKLNARHAIAEGKVNNRPQLISASGNPLLVSNKTDKVATDIRAARAVYTTSTSMLELSGKVNITTDGDQFHAERIFYHSPTGKLWSDSSQPVSALFKLKKSGQKLKSDE